MDGWMGLGGVELGSKQTFNREVFEFVVFF